MAAYNEYLYNLFMAPIENMRLNKKRHLLLEEVAGDVLEIGFGTGANIPHYPYEQMDSLTLLEHDMPNRVNLKPMLKSTAVTLLQGDVIDLPFEDKSYDSVVFTLVFCSVSDPVKGLEEIKRVLRPGGRIYFIEHVIPTKQPYKKFFIALTPLWHRLTGSCHLNRDTITTIQQCGFKLLDYHRFYRTSFVWGIAEQAE